MRKLKLQVQTSADGFVCGPNSEMDWMTWNWDEGLMKYVTELTEPVDTILLGRKLAEGFIPHWMNAAKTPEQNPGSEKLNSTPKVLFSTTMTQEDVDSRNWERTRHAVKELKDEVNDLKSRPGGDLIAYGGANFVSSLINEGLIDEYHLFVNPAAIGEGKRIFTGHTPLKLEQSSAFDCGIVVLKYVPQTA